MEEAIRHVVVMFAALTLPAALYVGIRWSNIKLKRMEGAATGQDEALAGRVAELEQQLLDLQERMDFTERVLAAKREADQLHG